MNNKIKELAKKNIESIIKIRRELHKYPELSFDLPKTVEIIKRELDKLGIEYKSEVGKSGIVALIKGKKEGKTVLLRADMDALPIQEESRVDFKSEHRGCMHACGHDGHSAGLLGTAMILNEIKDELKGNVKLIFQPAEEGPGGAEPMIKDGVLENPKVDAAFACHLWPSIKGGQIGIKYGDMMAHPSEFYITIQGVGGHASEPEKTIDPIIIATQIINNFQNIKSRNISTFKPFVISTSFIHAGSAANIIPDSIDFGGTIRSYDYELTSDILDRMEQMVENICNIYGAKYSFRRERLYPPLKNDVLATKILKASATKIIGENNIIEMEFPVMGGEDFSYIANEVPSTFFFVGIRDDQEDVESNLHHPRLYWNDKRLEISSAILAQVAYDYLES